MNKFFADLFKDESNERRLREVYEKAEKKLDTGLEPTRLIKNIVARYCKLSEEFIDKYFKNELGNIILSYQRLSSDYLIEKIRKNSINVGSGRDLISIVLLNQKIDEKYIHELVGLYESSPSKAWSIVSCKQELSLEFIEENLKYFSESLSNIVFYQPKVDFQFLSKIVDLENIESLSENVFKYIISSINLPPEFIRDNWNYLSLNKIILSDLLYLQPRIPEDLLLQLKDLLGERAYNRRIFKTFSSSGNYSLIYSVCNEDGLILYPVSFSDLEYSFEYDTENHKINLYKTVVDIRKIPRMKFLYKNFCEKLIEIDKNEVVNNNSSVYKRFKIITPPEKA